ncbi:MAG TPA: hypothetical protein VNL77_16700 [Roseiflexaceae bacterium]|nr:hypothetical protein [Roseiflexaceae bacterium]
MLASSRPRPARPRLPLPSVRSAFDAGRLTITPDRPDGYRAAWEDGDGAWLVTFDACAVPLLITCRLRETSGALGRRIAVSGAPLDRGYPPSDNARARAWAARTLGMTRYRALRAALEPHIVAA